MGGSFLLQIGYKNDIIVQRNQAGNAFWQRLGFTGREDLTYRNRSIRELNRIDT